VSERDTDQVIRVVAAVIVRDGTLLVGRRRLGLSHAGDWELPGGKIEPGESPERALVREIREELGVGVVVGDLVTRAMTPVADNRAIDLWCYAAELEGKVPTVSTDHDRLLWQPIDQTSLLQLTWSIPDQLAIAEVGRALAS
jgi:8-oxo-dGTP diphosphatase